MHTVTFTITGSADYAQSRFIREPKKERENHETHEQRTWRQRAHVNDDGHIIIPPMAVKNMLSDTARFLGIQIPGKGKSTYTKHFEAGILCVEPALVQFPSKGGKLEPVPIDSIPGLWLHVPSDGKRGGSKRVMKCYPTVPAGWSAHLAITVLDDMITKPVLKLHLERAGQFIGLGSFRPRNNGIFGRFEVSNIAWTKIENDLEDAA